MVAIIVLSSLRKESKWNVVGITASAVPIICWSDSPNCSPNLLDSFWSLPAPTFSHLCLLPSPFLFLMPSVWLQWSLCCGDESFSLLYSPCDPYPRPPAWALPPEKGADLCPDWGISRPYITRDPVHSHISRRGSHWRVCGWAVCRGVGYVQGGGNGGGCLNEWENSKDGRSDPGQSDLQAIPPLPPRSRDKADVILALSSSSLPE